MALKIQIKPSQKILINGAVIENASGRAASLIVHNNAAILRDQDIMQPEAAVTPATRTYYALQCMYIFPDEATRYKSIFKGFVETYEQAAPSSRPIIDEICVLVDSGHVFQALKAARKLIAHEGEVLRNVEQKLAQTLRHTDRAGKSPQD